MLLSQAKWKKCHHPIGLKIHSFHSILFFSGYTQAPQQVRFSSHSNQFEYDFITGRCNRGRKSGSVRVFQQFFIQWKVRVFDHKDALTELDSSCPGSLLKTTPLPSGCPWVPRGPEVTPEPSFRGLVLDHQVWKQPEAKNLSKIAKFDQKQQFLSVF